MKEPALIILAVVLALAVLGLIRDNNVPNPAAVRSAALYAGRYPHAVAVVDPEISRFYCPPTSSAVVQPGRRLNPELVACCDGLFCRETR